MNFSANKLTLRTFEVRDDILVPSFLLARVRSARGKEFVPSLVVPGRPGLLTLRLGEERRAARDLDDSRVVVRKIDRFEEERGPRFEGCLLLF